ncbi:hypothetical protein KC19_5G083000 [Ceratodon purpureus]|uniref:Dof-type domain-containing protein n=1 Tax=Ceratodon purpureus TaxID=3225 RepID=A0A8T0I004_CERPU|nr:hypothetical protein KC19_5G083000 [Ceratodon purpureus]
MAKEPKEYATIIKYCPGNGTTNCGSSNVRFKYLNNGQPDQPRYQCLDCKRMFTLGDHGRKKPGHYKKKRNEDPDEFKGLSIKCTLCGALNQCRFKYYNNNNPTQPRFKCLKCLKQFQMRFDGRNKLMPAKVIPRKTKPIAAKQGRKIQANTSQASTHTMSTRARTRASTQATSPCEYNVVTVTEDNQLSNMNDHTFFGDDSESEEEQSDHGEYCESVQMPEMAVGIPYHGEGDWTTPMSVENVNANEEQQDQSYFGDVQGYSEALGKVLSESDVGQNLSLYGSDASCVDQISTDPFSNMHHVFENQSEYVGPYSSAYDYDMQNMEPVNQVYDIQNTEPVNQVEYSDIGQFYNPEVNAEYTNQFFYNNTIPMSKFVVAHHPWNVEMELATIFPNDDAMLQ